MNKFVLLMCDNDGTLVDSENLHYQSIANTAIKFGAEGISHDDWWKHCSGKGHIRIWHWLKDTNDHFKIEQDNFIKRCEASYIRNLFNLKAQQGIYGFLSTFHKHTGIFPPIVSNTNTNVVKKGLQQTGLDAVSGAVYGSDYFVSHRIERKPSPAPWLHVAANYGIKSFEMNKVIIIEDSESGCKSAKESGAVVVQIGFHPSMQYKAEKSIYADHYIGSGKDELKQMAKQLLV